MLEDLLIMSWILVASLRILIFRGVNKCRGQEDDEKQVLFDHSIWN